VEGREKDGMGMGRGRESLGVDFEDIEWVREGVDGCEMWTGR
jgi:hypothetical protein